MVEELLMIATLGFLEASNESFEDPLEALPALFYISAVLSRLEDK